MKHRITEGSPHPLGATWDGSGTNFALFSANATAVDLCLFSADGRREVERVRLPEHTHEVWHGYLADVRPGQLYGYRVHGPYAPAEGHRFNPHKLLVDPYAKALAGELRWHDALHGYRLGHKRGDDLIDKRDSARYMPKCQVVDPAFTWGGDLRPQRPWTETIFYEAHVKGMTQRHPDLPPATRGTFAGLSDPRVIEHLVGLGVTALELMPVQAFYDDRFLVEKGLTNYWGYSTLCFHAPATRYISEGADFHEFKSMVKRLHEADIEVILDVVYNHTAEGNHLGPTLSFRGIDNASYYLLSPDDKRFCFDTTGTGNTVNMRHPRVMQMVMDSLRYWVEECHIDGFRFDLASTLGRDFDEFDPHSSFLDAVAQDPVLQTAKMIAEPWDVGVNGYQLGNFPPGWAEWNGRYRDDVRSYWKMDEGYTGGIASALTGSAGLFDHHGRKPWASVNFVTAHDGFTMMDLWSYNEKHNEANGEDNKDGHGDNRSWNCGVEGETDDPVILATRDRLRRATMATLVLSQGTPMILMGDEWGRSRRGNNNGYCQDNEINWIAWPDPDVAGGGEDESEGLAGESASEFADFTAALVRLRMERPLLHPGQYMHGEAVPRQGQLVADNDDASLPRNLKWFRLDGAPMRPEDWENGQGGRVQMMLSGAGERSLMMMLNPRDEAVPYRLPARAEGDEPRWRLILDTGTGEVEPEGQSVPTGEDVTVGERTLLLFETVEPLGAERRADNDDRQAA